MNQPPLPTSPARDLAEEKAVIHLMYRDGSGAMHYEPARDRLEEALRDPAGLLWVDIQGSEAGAGDRVECWLSEVFQFHSLAIEDALRETHIPKVDDWGSYLYLVFHVPNVESRSDALVLEELDIFLGMNYLLTYHTVPLDLLDQQRASLQRDPRDRLGQGADYLLFLFLERAVDQSLAVIEQLDERVDTLQNLVLEHPDPKTLRTIFRVKRSAIRLHKTLAPQREVLNKLARDSYRPIRAEHRVYFRDLYDHLVRIHDISESLRDLIAGTLETYLSVVSNRTNDIMKTLTMVTVMFLPMSFLAGFFGMNFFGEKLAFQAALPRALLFVGTCVIMTISPCFIWIYARRRKWF